MCKQQRVASPGKTYTNADPLTAKSNAKLMDGKRVSGGLNGLEKFSNS